MFLNNVTVRGSGVSSPEGNLVKISIVKTSGKFVCCKILVMSNCHLPDAEFVQSLKDVANKLRIHSINSTNASNSG